MTALTQYVNLDAASGNEGWRHSKEGTYWALGFDSGSTEPSVSDTIEVNGATSNNGVVDEVILLSGTFGGGDAAGILILTSKNGTFSDGQQLDINGGTADFATTNIGSTWDTPNGDGGAHNEWRDAEAHIQQNYITNEHTVKILLGTDGIDFLDTAVTISGHTQNATYRLTCEGNADEQGKVTDESRYDETAAYALKVTFASDGLTINDDFTIIRCMQIRLGSGLGNKNCVAVNGTDVEMDQVRILQDSTGNGIILASSGGGARFKLHSSILTKTTTGNFAVRGRSSIDEILNCTFVDWPTGITNDAGLTDYFNNFHVNCATEFQGFNPTDEGNNASTGTVDDQIDTNPQNDCDTTDDYGLNGSEDYRPRSTSSKLHGNGNATTKATTDVNGVAFSSDNIGAFNTVDSGNTQTVSVTATATASLSRSLSYKQTISANVVATPGLTKAVGKLIDPGAVATPAVTFDTGGKEISADIIATPSLLPQLRAKRVINASVVATPSLRKAGTKSIQADAIVDAVVQRVPVTKTDKQVSASVVATASLQTAIILFNSRAATAIGTATLQRKITKKIDASVIITPTSPIQRALKLNKGYSVNVAANMDCVKTLMRSHGVSVTVGASVAAIPVMKKSIGTGVTVTPTLATRFISADDIVLSKFLRPVLRPILQSEDDE